VTLIVGIVFGTAPLMHGLANPALREAGRGNTASRGRNRVRQILMGAQVALALVLLAAAGLMIRSLNNVRSIDPGFDPRSALTFRIGLPARVYPTRAAAVAAHQAIASRVSTVPGAALVSAATCLPLAAEGFCYGNSLRVEGRDVPVGAVPPIVAFRAVTGGFIQAMGMRLVRGQGITASDVARGEPVVVVNEALARAYFPTQDPIGQRVAQLRTGGQPQWLTIVGIVGNTPAALLTAPQPPKMYMPISVASGPDTPPGNRAGPDIMTLTYVVRAAGSATALVGSVRAAVGSVSGDLAIAQVRTLEETLDRASVQMAFTMALLAIAAIIALSLGLIGIYGVLSYIVGQRRNEIGIRLALGATPTTVVGMIVRQGGFVTLIGVAIGLAVVLAGTRLMNSLLYNVSPRDPVILSMTAAVVFVVALLACWGPAQRAARVNPTEALRAD
jgi:putative ABC transport system permease protein